jgi:MFS family permease
VDSAAAPQPAADQQPMAISHLLKIAVYWFGINAIWGGIWDVVLPTRVDQIDPARAGALLAIITTAGVLMALAVQPTIGLISDYTISRWGRRKPYIVIGTLLDIVFLVGIATSQTFVALLAFTVLLQFSSNFAQGPFQGFVPDLVPRRQVGLVSGFMGAMIVLGRVTGVAIAAAGLILGDLLADHPDPALRGLADLSLPVATVALGLVELVTMVLLVIALDDRSPVPRRRRSWWGVALSAWRRDVLRERSVLWMLGVRLCFLAGLNSSALAILYFRRSHGLTAAEAGTYLLIAAAIVGLLTVSAAIPGGRISDRLGRRRVIWVACALGALGLTGAAFAPTPLLAIAAFIPIGIGSGAFLATDWALMTDIVPKETTGRFMGILNAGTAAAGPVFLIVGGLAMDQVGASELGFGAGPRAAFLVGAGFMGLAALNLTRVDPRRRERASHGVAAVAPQ